MMINRPASLGSVLAAVLLVLMPAQQLFASVAILSVAGGEREPIARSVIKETVIGERFEAKDKEILEVLLSDGTSLTLGPGSAMVIESFACDPQTQSGQLNVRLERGRFRIVGGLLNNACNIVVQTPTGKLDLDSASVFVEVDANGATRASLLHGKSLKLTTNGQSETVERPAFEVVSTATNQPPKGPSKQTPETAAADAMALNSELLNIGPDLQFAATALDETESGSVEDPGGQGSLVLASLSATGNETPFTSGPLTTAPPPSEPPAPPPPTFTRPQPINTALNPSGGFGPGQPINAANISDDQPSQLDGDKRSLAQVRDSVENGVFSEPEPTREKGRTTNRLFNSSSSFTQVLGNEKPVPVGDIAGGNPPDISTNLQYVFFDNQGGGNGSSLAIDRVGINLDGGRHVLVPVGGSFDVSAPFVLLGIELPQPNKIFHKDSQTNTGQGSIFKDATHFQLLQAGFSQEEIMIGGGNRPLVKRDADNFLLLEVRPGQVDKRVRDTLKDNFVIDGGGINDPIAFINDINIPIRTRFGNEALTSRRQVDLFSNVALTEIANLGIVAADVKGINDPGYNSYISKIQSLLDKITALGADPASGISSALARDIRIAFEGSDGTFIDFNPTVDIGALKALSISGGKISDPIAFIKALGNNVTFNLDFTLQDINALAIVILKANLKPGTPLAEIDLTAFGFLSEDEQLTIRNTVNRILLTSLDPNRTERYLFATGDIDNRLKATFRKEFSVDQFFISPGLEGFEEGITTNAAGDVVYTGKTVASSIRAFLRKETGLGLKLADTGLLVVNPGPESSATKSTLLHADFGLQETPSGQQSTISVTIGNVEYKLKTCDCNPPPIPPSQSVEAVVEARTIGSSHGIIKQVNQDGTEVVVNGATVVFSSPIRSTAAGGGNPALKKEDGTIREGYAGYFVLENYDPTPQDPGEGPLMGGTEKPLGGSGSDQNYAYLRLATATGSSKPMLRSELTLNGWMGGLAEFQNGNGIGLTQVDSGDTPDNVKIETSPANNTAAASFTLFGQNPSQSTTFNLGGLSVNGASAFVDDNRFAARSINNGYEVAIVTADLFRDANGNLPASLNRPDATSIPQYEHLKWGFFFGDTKTTAGQREHVHLGTWIAGKIPTGDSLGLKGTATYTGHSIGNVFNNGSLYTAVGSFQNDWNFDTRKGTANMNFDKMNYTGTTAIKGSSFNFDGTLSAPGRSGGLQGSFVAPVNPTPAAVMGGFAIAETPGNATYRAAGTFGAERK